MFWRFGGYANISTLDTILDKPDVTIEDLLDESDLIQELKQQNSKLIEFLRAETVLKKLLDYVVAQKPQSTADENSKDEAQNKDADNKAGLSFFGRAASTRDRSKSVSKRDADDGELEKQEARRKKYAYVACEVLSSDVWSITEAVLEQKEQLKIFWQFLYQSAPLDALQAGYFTKVNESLLDKKTEDMLTFLKSLDGIVPAMLQHVDCPTIMDLLLKIISLEKHDGGVGIVDWLQTQDLIPLLLRYLSPDYPSATQTSAGDFLKAIITISANATPQDQSVIGPNELTRQLVSAECIEILIQDMLRGGNPLTVGVGIIIEVIRKNNSDYDVDTQVGIIPKSSDPIYLGTLLRRFATHVPDFMKLIRSKSSQKSGLKVAFGTTIEPLGFDRFKTCELMAELLHCSNMGLLNERGAEDEVRTRDAERERLKAEAADDDGFEKVSAPSTDELPDEVNFDDLSDKFSEDTPAALKVPSKLPHFDPPPTRAADSPTTGGVTDKLGGLDMDDDTVMTEFGEDSANNFDDDAPSELERELAKADKPAPLFSKSPPQSQDIEQSTATLQPDNAPLEESIESPGLQADADGRPVVGDLLKLSFVENQVIPTILDFFFRFPWNNFLHNVVYDVVQQVFNGVLERGYNRALALDLFSPIKVDEDKPLGLLSYVDITQRILDGQAASDKSQEQKNMRLGYMGHLTLIAEEVCKFGNRFPADGTDSILESRIQREEWLAYVDGILADTREKDNAVLGGVRPENAMMRPGSTQAGFTANATHTLASAGIGAVVSEQDNHTAAEGTDDESYESGGTGNVSHFVADEDNMEDREVNERRGSSGSQFSEDEQEQSTSTTSIPPPLNTPSRARRQLAARLAQKKKEAQAAEMDPDSVDHAALETASHLPQEPVELGLPPDAERERQEAGLHITGMRSALGSGSASKFSGLFGSDDSSSDSSLDEDDAGRDETLDRDEDDYEDTPITFGRRRDATTVRRPSTTEVTERRLLDDDDDDDDEDTSRGPFADSAEVEE